LNTNHRLAKRVKKASTARIRISVAGPVTRSGAPLNTSSMAVFDSQSMRFSATWNTSSISVPATYLDRCRRNCPPRVTGKLSTAEPTVGPST
jgi:hypothetical protein